MRAEGREPRLQQHAGFQQPGSPSLNALTRVSPGMTVGVSLADFFYCNQTSTLRKMAHFAANQTACRKLRFNIFVFGIDDLINVVTNMLRAKRRPYFGAFVQQINMNGRHRYRRIYWT